MPAPPTNLSLILASASPRRHALLPLLGFPIEFRPTETDERPLADEAPDRLVLRLAMEKALAAGSRAQNRAAIGCDTVVVLDGELLGKPVGAADAARTLKRLRGLRHDVLSGVAIVRSGTLAFGTVVRTAVRIRRYSDDEIDSYVASGRPLDKAGAYAIQDRDFDPVEAIDGCYLNVVGLPLCALARGLREQGWPLPDESLEPPCRYCLEGRPVVER